MLMQVEAILKVKLGALYLTVFLFSTFESP